MMSPLSRVWHALKRAGLWGLISFAVFGPCMVAVVFWASTQPMMVFQDVRELDGAAIHGGSIDIYAHIMKNRECDTSVDRWLWHWVEVEGQRRQAFVQIVAPAAPPVPVGQSTYILTLALPRTVTAGDWFYIAVAHSNCSWLPALLGAQERKTRDIPVHIGEASRTNPETVLVQPDSPVLLMAVPPAKP